MFEISQSHIKLVCICMIVNIYNCLSLNEIHHKLLDKLPQGFCTAIQYLDTFPLELSLSCSENIVSELIQPQDILLSEFDCKYMDIDSSLKKKSRKT